MPAIKQAGEKRMNRKEYEKIVEETKKLENCINVLLEVYGDPKLGTPELTVILKLMKKKDVFVNKGFEIFTLFKEEFRLS